MTAARSTLRPPAGGGSRRPTALLVRVAIAVVLVAGPAVVGCGSPLPPLPLRPAPIPYADTLPIPEPAEREPIEPAELFKESVGGEAVAPFNLRRRAGDPHEALNVTHFDDVVSSAWFEHRNARRRMSTEAVARGPASTTGPDTSRALTVIAGKEAGISPGFTIRDARGGTWIIKFDPKEHLYLSSAADVIASRLFHAAGYHVPEDHIVVFDSARLVIDPDAEITTERGKRGMTRADLRATLARTDPLPNGRFLAVASKFLPGTPKGPFFFEGVRPDDPNDHYHHQYRRELRGLYVMSAWLNHVDMRFANTLDVYVEPGYLRHYLIDFGAALGSGTIHPHRPREGSEYNFDFWPTLARIFTLGFFTTGWEGRPYEEIDPSIGWMPVESYDPGNWKANWPNPAFRAVTPPDGYWGAKLVASFTDEQLRAAVGAGQLPDPAAADTLVKILAYRRDRTVQHWFGRVTPVEEVRVEAGTIAAGDGPSGLRISFDDLGLASGHWTGDATTYRWSFEHPALGHADRGRSRAAAGARQTLEIPLSGMPGVPESLGSGDALGRLRLTAIRPGASGRPATVYLRWLPSERRYRVVGLQH